VIRFVNENFTPIIVNKYQTPEVDDYFRTLSEYLFQASTNPLFLICTKDLIPVQNVLTQLERTDPTVTNILATLEDGIKLSLENKDSTTLFKEAFQNPIVDESKRIEFSGEFPNAPAILENTLEQLDNYFQEENIKFFPYPFFEWFVEQVLEGVIPKEQGQKVVPLLEKVLASSLVDHVRGGVFSFCLDKNWTYPHFEKKLYQQSALLRVLAKFSLIYNSPLVLDLIIQTLTYLDQEMLHHDGYFMNSQDSCTDGVEGFYFSFSQDEFLDALKDFDEDLLEHSQQLQEWFCIDQDGDTLNKLNVIRLNMDHSEEFLQPNNWELVRKTKQALLQSRQERIPPNSDNAGSASWNFELISSLCDVIQYSRVHVVKDLATQLLNKCLDGVHSSFFSKEKDKSRRLNHSTLSTNETPYFEDYVSFIDAHIRLYEITGRKKFKENVIMSIQFALKEFFDGSFFVTKKESSDDVIENLIYPLFDHTHFSSSARFLGILRKYSTLNSELMKTTGLDELYEKLKQFTLFSPLYFGEALRSLTYPTQTYKLLSVPKAWVEEEDFLMIRTYLSNRFLIDYSSPDLSWEISNIKESEVKGVGLSEFKEFMTGKA